MKRKLILLNVVLAALAGAAAWQLHVRQKEIRAQEGKLLRQAPPPPAPVPVPELNPPPPARPADYGEVAQKTLFTPDRNPDVVIEAPPPKPVPPFPVAYGLMSLGDAPTVILSEKPGAPNRGYRAGDKVGDFVLAAIHNDELVFEWDGKQFRKTLQDLKPDANTPPPAPAPVAAAVPAPVQEPAPAPVTTTVGSVSTSSSQADSGPGRDTGDGYRACVAGDTSPAGTVRDGFKKVIYQTPFVAVCRWEPVN
ncbi:MAG: hypothetical protein K6T61_03495 [Bryobacteraceae bacterium]|nr:hypothetical protein [Bryobacteraceae bacterium]